MKEREADDDADRDAMSFLFFFVDDASFLRLARGLRSFLFAADALGGERLSGCYP